MSHTLHLRDLTKRFGSTVALSPLTLSFPGGRFTSLLGPSGCGKSTLLRLITGLERPSDGQIFVDDTEITNVPPVRRKIGMVFQQYALFPNLTVAENVLYGLHGKGADGAPLWSADTRRERMREMLALVGLESFAERRPHELSGGQQQRVAIARALAPNPSILLLDEPLSALDAWSRTAIGEELREIQRKSGVTTLMVTHDRTEALTLSDYVAVLHDGKLEDFGTPDELYEHPKSAFSATFVGDMNLLTLPGSEDTVGIRYADVKLFEPTEQTIAAPESFVGKVQRLEFRGDMLRAHVLLNDFKTTVTADVVRVEHPWLREGALLVVRLPQARWCRW